MRAKKTASIILVTAIATAFATGSFAGSMHHHAKVKCSGINGCKGKSQCKSASNSCKGQNACKGKGWISVSSAEKCTKKGGTVVQ